MKLKFKTQDFQTAAVAAVVDLFKGQEKRRDTFTIMNEKQGSLDNLGYTNTLTLTDGQIIANMNAVFTSELVKGLCRKPVPSKIVGG